jgi:hypothetical protein
MREVIMDLLGLIIVFLLNSVIGIYISERIKNNFEQRILLIQQQNSLEITKLTHELNQLASIHNIQFGELHQRRANSIVEIYKLLSKVERRLKYSIDPLPHPKIIGELLPIEKYNSIKEDIDALLIYIDENKILFSKSQGILLESIYEIINSIDNTIYFRALFEEHPLTEEEKRLEREKLITDWVKEAKDKYEKIYPAIKVSLEEDFRSTLGFDIKT